MFRLRSPIRNRWGIRFTQALSKARRAARLDRFVKEIGLETKLNSSGPPLSKFDRNVLNFRRKKVDEVKRRALMFCLT